MLRARRRKGNGQQAHKKPLRQSRCHFGFQHCQRKIVTEQRESRAHLVDARGGEQLDTTTEPTVDSLSPRRRSGGGSGSTAIELTELQQNRSADFSPLPTVLAGLEGCGLKCALLNSMAVE